MKKKKCWADITAVVFLFCPGQIVKFWALESQAMTKEVIFLLPMHSSLPHINISLYHRICLPACWTICMFKTAHILNFLSKCLYDTLHIYKINISLLFQVSSEKNRPPKIILPKRKTLGCRKKNSAHLQKYYQYLQCSRHTVATGIQTIYR